MQKKIFLTTILLILFSSIILLNSQEVKAFQPLYLDLYFGAKFQSLNLESFEKWVYEEYGVEETFRGEVGFFAGARQWFELGPLKNIAIGGEIDRMAISYSDLDISLSSMGLLISLTYNLSKALGDFPGEILLAGAGGVYLARLVDGEIDFGRIEENYIGPGFKVGLEISMPLGDRYSVGGRAGYRYSQPHSEGDIEFSGLEFDIKFGINL